MMSFIVDDDDTLAFHTLFQNATQQHAVVFLIFLRDQLTVYPLLLAIKW